MIKNILNGHLTGCTYPDASSLDGGLDTDHLLLPKPAFWSSTLTLRPTPASQSCAPKRKECSFRGMILVSEVTSLPCKLNNILV